ncbi:MAG: hypothetical protein HY720_10290 [Planctomycetes bacterium]|nr:hypothetical protein [Planctomycetota bacterium]
MASKGDAKFGRLAVEKGYLSQRIVDLYVEKVNQARSSGKPTTIERLLLADRLLTSTQIYELQDLEGKRVQLCPECGARHNVFSLEPGTKVRCKKCRKTFQVEFADLEEPPKPAVTRVPPARQGEGNDPASSKEPRRPASDDPPTPVPASQRALETAGDDGPALFGCPVCGADLTLEDEFCPHCAGPRDGGD